MNSDYSDDEFHDTNAVYDWESLLEDTSQSEQASAQVTKKEMNNARKLYKKKVLKIGESLPAEQEELSLDSLSIRQKLVEKWSDLKGVTAKNVTLLHEQTPSTPAEIEQFFDSTFKLLPSGTDETNHYGSFLTSFATTFVNALLTGDDEKKSAELVHETITKAAELRQADFDARKAEETPSNAPDSALNATREDRKLPPAPSGSNLEEDFM